jgi:acyl-CoA reductase-like NAD-dependent aldehyde dehydrogenase
MSQPVVSDSDATPYRFHELPFEGRWQPGGAPPLEVSDPWSSETIARIAAANVHDVDRAFVAAAHAQPVWAARLPGEKAAVFLRAARVMEARRAEIHDAFVARFVERARGLAAGAATDPGTALGPLINRAQFDKIVALVERARAAGARLLLGEPARGLVMPPQVFDQVTMDMEIARAEIFGPVATILRAYGDADAIRIANETSYGLTSGVLCHNLGRAMAIAHRIEAGMTHINDIPAVDMPQMPFGGEKNSGLGRFGSEGMLDAFTTQHWISIQHTEVPLPF